jgi:hypothetical protein
VAVAVALLGIIVWGLTRLLIPGARERAATHVLDEVSMPHSFEFRQRFSQGSGGFDFNDTYLGPASEVEPSMLGVPETFRPSTGVASDVDHRYVRAWVGSVGDLECYLLFEQLLDPIDQSVFANLDGDEAARVKAGRLAVVQVSVICGRR